MERVRAWAAALLLSCAAAPVWGQGIVEPVRPAPNVAITKLRSVVNVKVTGRVAEVEVEEWFRNDGGAFGEADYLYPIPAGAVFSGYSLFQGDTELTGETMDAGAARSIYEEIVRRRRDPALIELVGNGLLRARVFPFAAGETRRIRLRFTQLLERNGDAVAFRYAAGARNSGAAQRGRDGAPLTFTLIAGDREYCDAFSPTHSLDVSTQDGRLTVRPRMELSGEFAVFLSLAGRSVGLSLATHRPSASEDGYFMLTLSPADIAGARVPRDLTVVVDVSGSMSGEKLEQARGAVRQLLGTLGQQDRFRLVRFSSAVGVYRDGWTAATSEELRAARQWVDRLTAEGGTNIAGALTEAFLSSSPSSRLPVVVFMTDGQPTVDEQDPERIAAQASRDAGRTRVFAFGVGYDVNTYLLDALTAAARGSTQYVRPGEDVETAVGVLAAKVQHPVLTDIEIADAPVVLSEIYPSPLPDLYAGEDLVILGRYRAGRSGGSGPIAVRGKKLTEDGSGVERYSVHGVFPAHASGNDWLPRLWASRKLGFLAREIRLNGADPELVEELKNTALRYGLLSEYTAYLVQEPEDRRDVVAFSPAPMASAGAAAVERAEASRRAREAVTLADVASAQKMVVSESDGGAQTAAGRMFRRVGGEYQDQRHRADQRVVAVEPYSDAYFAVMRALPELREPFMRWTQVLVAGERVSVRVVSGGARTLTAAELNALVQAFRGR